MNFPDDLDGDVLRELEENNFDFSKEYVIDFNIDFNDWPLKLDAKAAISKIYPNCKFIDPSKEDIANGDLVGYVQFQIIGKLSYDLVVKTQERATDQMQPFGGWCDSWGLFHE